MHASEGLRIKIRLGNPEEAEVVVAGELDVATAAALDDQMSVLLDRQVSPSRVTLDLSRLEFIDATGIGVLERLGRRARTGGKSLRLTRPSRAVRRILVVLDGGVDLPIEDGTAEVAHDCDTPGDPSGGDVGEGPRSRVRSGAENHSAVELAETFGELARSLEASHDAQSTLQRIVDLAVETIDGCEHAGLSMVWGRKVTSPASSDPIPAVVDGIQSETGEGPCLDTITDHSVFKTGRLSEEHRWPKFAHRTYAETAIESVLAFRLFVEEDTMGALNLYSTRPDAFDDYDIAIGAVFAAHAAVAYSNARKIESLEAGIDSRQVIGQAVGILMARQNVGEQDAFNMLVRASQRMNTKLRRIAEQITQSTNHQPPARPERDSIRPR